MQRGSRAPASSCAYKMVTQELSRSYQRQPEHCCRKGGYVTGDLRLNKDIRGRAHYFAEERRLEAFSKMAKTCPDPHSVVFATVSSSRGCIVVAGFSATRL
ncbi:hypothetical protein MTO96_006940 [Rhipicephalus appendiculatus]